MALEDLLRRIEDEARAEADRILREGHDRAAAKKREWGERAGREAESIRQAARDDAERLRRQTAAQAKLEAGKALAGAKREFLERVTADARRRIMDDKPLHKALLRAMLERELDAATTAVAFSGDPVGREASEALSAARRGQVRVSVAPADSEPRGGIILTHGLVTVNLSLALLLEELADREQVALQKILFGERRE